MLQIIVHYTLHIFAPGIIAWFFFRARWSKVWLILLLTMAVDLDHLLMFPDVFVSHRCSVGLHLLHSYWAISIYILSLFWRKTRIIAVGLIFHMITDWLDCFWMMY
ncbi:DUF6122 family protein [Cyclobacteriaceae bacterium]|nr:DUF6122 family protein [Cyclobacteriaceae bacterium]MDB4314888.1 DUF6122 family protein [Cyclobacteriaceae bacterium]MDB4602852.1 DUF6122 family protein [Cyclobacteriaceae bacterium]MDB9883660.1 DUF6122 family protein [Cyclobacteriaceae bacterium]MDC1369518.1 DUF6122 family protein [Cyclobacteriaceae bacterium]